MAQLRTLASMEVILTRLESFGLVKKIMLWVYAYSANWGISEIKKYQLFIFFKTDSLASVPCHLDIALGRDRFPSTLSCKAD